MVIETESLKSRILKLQKDLGRIAANREDITSEDVLKLSRDLDIHNWHTRSVNKQYIYSKAGLTGFYFNIYK